MSSLKSLWPGVSSRFQRMSSYSNCSTEVVTEMPRCFSSAIQSLTAERFALRDLTAPAA